MGLLVRHTGVRTGGGNHFNLVVLSCLPLLLNILNIIPSLWELPVKPLGHPLHECCFPSWSPCPLQWLSKLSTFKHSRFHTDKTPNDHLATSQWAEQGHRLKEAWEFEMRWLSACALPWLLPIVPIKLKRIRRGNLFTVLPMAAKVIWNSWSLEALEVWIA